MSSQEGERMPSTAVTNLRLGRLIVSREARASAGDVQVPRWLLPTITVALAVNALGWCAYLVLIPAALLRTSPSWAGALAVVPGGDPGLIGGALGVAAVLIVAGALRSRWADLALLGHVVGVGAWLLLAGSHGWNAAHSQGLGAGAAVVFLLLGVLHGVFTMLRRY